MAATTIRAAYHRARGVLDLGEATLPDPGDGEVVVRVEACGVCATNLHAWAAAPAGASALPGAHGHEVAGVVERLGPDVRRLAVGDRVCLDPAVACGCGRCGACVAGDPMRCRSQAPLPVWGFSDAVVVPTRSLVAVPPGVDMATASLAEPLASAVHGLRHCHAAAADGRIDGVEVAVLGAGALGLLAAVAARHLGARTVTVLARHDRQAELAELLGADRVVRDGDGSDHATMLRRLRPGLVVEAAGGHAATLELAFASVDRGGEVVVLGLFDGPRALDVNAAVMRNVRAFFSAAYAARGGETDVEVAVSLLAATPALGLLVTHRLPLAEIARAAAIAGDRAAGSCRVVLCPC